MVLIHVFYCVSLQIQLYHLKKLDILCFNFAVYIQEYKRSQFVFSSHDGLLYLGPLNNNMEK